MIREYVGNHIFNVRGNLNGLGSMWLSWRNKLLLVNRYFEVYCFGVIRYSRSKVPGNTKKRTWYQVPIKFLDAIFRYFITASRFRLLFGCSCTSSGLLHLLIVGQLVQSGWRQSGRMNAPSCTRGKLHVMWSILSKQSKRSDNPQKL